MPSIAGRSTRALLDDDGMVSADIRALPAADALIRVDLRPSVCAVKFYRVLWADLHAGVRETSLTAVRHIDLFSGHALQANLITLISGGV